MGYVKLRNPKPGVTLVPPDGVHVSCRQLKFKARKGGGERQAHRFAVIRIGATVARKAGLAGDKHRVNVLLGEGLERHRCGIALDDKGGEFAVRRRASGDFQLTITERAAAGTLRLDVPAFTAKGDLVPITEGRPPCIMFDLSKAWRE